MFIAILNVIKGEDNYVAQGKQNGVKKKNISVFSGQITTQTTQQNDR